MILQEWLEWNNCVGSFIVYMHTNNNELNSVRKREKGKTMQQIFDVFRAWCKLPHLVWLRPEYIRAYWLADKNSHMFGLWHHVMWDLKRNKVTFRCSSSGYLVIIQFNFSSVQFQIHLLANSSVGIILH